MQTRGEVTVAERADVLLASANATRSAATAVDLVYTVAGATANYRRSPLQRALRDIHAVTQHIATAPSQYESSGRMLLGLRPLHSRILLGAPVTPNNRVPVTPGVRWRGREVGGDVLMARKAIPD